MLIKRNYKKSIICWSLIFTLTGCSSFRDYATSDSNASRPETTVIAACVIKPLSISKVNGPGYWSGPCGIDGAEKSGLAVWGTSDKPLARYTGPATHGKIDGDKASFFDAAISFKGVAKDGQPFLGALSYHGKGPRKGDKFEGRFASDGSYEHGVLRRADGTVVAGKFSGTQPEGEVVVRDQDGILRWAWANQNGNIRYGRKVVISRDGEKLGSIGIFAAAAGLGMAFLATGALAVGMATAAAFSPARAIFLIVRV